MMLTKNTSLSRCVAIIMYIIVRSLLLSSSRKPGQFFFIESFPQMCFEGKWLQNRLGADKNESRSLLAVDIQGHQCGGFCIVPTRTIKGRVLSGKLIRMLTREILYTC